MNLTRRALGLGILAASAAATGGYLALEHTPLLGKVTDLTGFVGGEKRGFLSNSKTIAALRSKGFAVDGKQAGSVEMVREQTLLQQNPAFLWPSSSVMVQIAKDNHVAVRRSEIILNSPLVIYSWENVANGLEAAGPRPVGLASVPEITEQVTHRGRSEQVGGAEGQVTDGPQLLLKLAGRRGLNREMSGVVGARRELVDYEAAGGRQEQLDAHDANHIQRLEDRAGGLDRLFPLLLVDARRCKGQIKDVMLVAIFDHAIVHEAPIAPARANHR